MVSGKAVVKIKRTNRNFKSEGIRKATDAPRRNVRNEDPEYDGGIGGAVNEVTG
jgi:hypothetical protein